MNANDHDGDEVKMAIGTMRGFREWDFLVGDPAGTLRSITSPFPWLDAEPPPAVCMRGSIAYYRAATRVALTHAEPAPLRTCSCGYYAHHLPCFVDTSGAHPQGSWDKGTSFRVGGVVEAFGRMIVGPYGFRAERVRVVALALISPGHFRAHVLGAHRLTGKMVPFDAITTPDVIDYVVGWPDGSNTRHMAMIPRYNDGQLTVDPMNDPELLLRQARRSMPEKARLERTYPYPVEEIEKRFGMPIYDDVRTMVRDFPPQESELIPKPKAKPGQQDAANHLAGGAVPGGQRQVTVTVNPSVTAQAFRNVVVRRNPNGTYTWLVT